LQKKIIFQTCLWLHFREHSWSVHCIWSSLPWRESYWRFISAITVWNVWTRKHSSHTERVVSMDTSESRHWSFCVRCQNLEQMWRIYFRFL